MLPLRYALVVAALVSALCGLWDAYATGFRLPLIYDRLSFSCEKYGLTGHATVLKLAAARRLAGASAAAGVGRDRADAAADAYAYAARLLVDLPDSREEAMGALRAGLRVAWWRKDLRARLLELQLAAGDRLAARTITDLAYRSNDPYAQFALARMHLQAGRPEDAGACMVRALKTLPRNHELCMAYARYLKSFGATDDAVPHAEAALLSARTFEEQLAAAKLLGSLGAEAPDPTDLLLSHISRQYSFTTLVVVLYLLALGAPAIRRRLRGGARHMAEWHAGLSAE